MADVRSEPEPLDPAVHVVARGSELAATMSDYLVRRIATSPRITVHACTEISAVAGDWYLRQVAWTDRRTGASETRDIANLFLMIGALPNTEWLEQCLLLD